MSLTDEVAEIVKDHAERFMIHYTLNAPAHDYGIEQIALAITKHLAERLPKEKETKEYISGSSYKKIDKFSAGYNLCLQAIRKELEL